METPRKTKTQLLRGVVLQPAPIRPVEEIRQYRDYQRKKAPPTAMPVIYEPKGKNKP